MSNSLERRNLEKNNLERKQSRKEKISNKTIANTMWRLLSYEGLINKRLHHEQNT